MKWTASLLFAAMMFTPLAARLRGDGATPWLDQARPASGALTNQKVIEMVTAGVPDDLIVDAIRNATERTFDLSPDALIGLAKAKVPAVVIRAMQGVDANPVRSNPADNAGGPTTSAESSAGELVIDKGRSVKVRLVEPVTSETARIGDWVDFEVVDDVVVDGHVVIKRGAASKGKVVDAVAQRLARPGKLELSVESVKAVTGTEVRISGRQAAEGGKGHMGRGQEVTISAAAEIAATVDERVVLKPQSGTVPAISASAAAERPAPSGQPQPAAIFNPLSTRSLQGREAGIYFNDRGTLVQLEPTAFSGSKTGNMMVSGLTYGIKKTKWKAVVRSGRATVRIHTAQPEFYFYFERSGSGLSNANIFYGASNPNEFVLAKMNQGSRERELTVGEFGAFGMSSGSNSEDTLDLVVEKLGPGEYKVTTKEPLKPGSIASSMRPARRRSRLRVSGSSSTSASKDDSARITPSPAQRTAIDSRGRRRRADDSPLRRR